MKLNVKPVYVHLVHRSAYMGPCRGGTWEQLERSYDEMMAAENFAKMKEGLEKVYGGEKDICLQAPVYLEFLDEFVVRESHFEKVKDEDTDVFLLDGMMGQHLAVNIAKRYRKPMVTVGCCTSTDTTACLRAAGFEGYGSLDLEGTKPILKTLLAKKAIAKAFRYQKEGKGFCMVEVLSTCPTNWGMSPVEAMTWLEENMIPYYPLGVYKDKEAK